MQAISTDRTDKLQSDHAPLDKQNHLCNRTPPQVPLQVTSSSCVCIYVRLFSTLTKWRKQVTNCDSVARQSGSTRSRSCRTCQSRLEYTVIETATFGIVDVLDLRSSCIEVPELHKCQDAVCGIGKVVLRVCRAIVPDKVQDMAPGPLQGAKEVQA
jgi:hypothetical protein